MTSTVSQSAPTGVPDPADPVDQADAVDPADAVDSADPAAEVVVALTNDESARRVADAGVRLAHELGAPVRFVHVLPARLDTQERSDADQPTFAAAMAAMRRVGPHARATFESTTGDPVDLLVERCEGARMLVIGHDVEEGVVGALCRQRVTCPVHEVTP